MPSRWRFLGSSRWADLDAVRNDTLARLRQVESTLAELDERERLLDQLTPHAEDDPKARSNPPSVAGAITVAPRDDDAAVTATVRAEGDRVCVDRRYARPRCVYSCAAVGIEALHYREWFELLAREGYSVAGKNGLAVFLTQICRSPAVHKGTQSGVYELDRDAPQRLARELDRLQAELRDLTGRTPGTTDLSEIRARRRQLASELGQTERALEEWSSARSAGQGWAFAEAT